MAGCSFKKLENRILPVSVITDIVRDLEASTAPQKENSRELAQLI